MNERMKLAQDLRDLANWIERHEELPLPTVSVGCWVRGATLEERTRCMAAFLAAYPHARASGHTTAKGTRLLALHGGDPLGILNTITCTPDDITPEFFREHFARFFAPACQEASA